MPAFDLLKHHVAESRQAAADQSGQRLDPLPTCASFTCERTCQLDLGMHVPASGFIMRLPPNELQRVQ